MHVWIYLFIIRKAHGHACTDYFLKVQSQFQIFHVVSWNKSVVYLLSFTKECILHLLTLFYERLIKTISCFAGKQLWESYANLMDKIYQSSSIHYSKVISKVKVSERMTDRTKTIWHPIFDLRGIKTTIHCLMIKGFVMVDFAVAIRCF